MTSSSDPARWRRLSELFDRAVDLDADARRILIENECAGDPPLRAELERLLAADAGSGAIDEGAAGLVDAGALQDRSADELRTAVGTRLGRWLIDGVLGRGGMGTVYAAHRDDRDSGQRAAVKRLQQRWDGSLQAQRFLQERRILAALSHPHIPRLFDHGLDSDGRPWFALEFVDGRPLTEWADARQLGLRERIDLFRTVCAAVRHAHEHFVVHRDLKPGNILVDREGHPKVLDFGVAKRIDDESGVTRGGLLVGFTPEYAAPEQVTGGPVSAATDVHALGVVLYELLAGRLPYEFDAGNAQQTAEAITSRPAARLEQALATGQPEAVAERLRNRRTDPRAFQRFVKGDLTRIVQTALAKEAPRRYASVQALSDDLKRFLEGRTVSVGGDTFAYRAGKFARRNRWGVAMAALAAAALTGGAAFSLFRAQQERIQRERSDAVLAFVGDLFAAGTDGDPHANQLTVPELLGRASGRIDNAFPHDPLGRAQLFNVVGAAYAEMGRGAPAVAYTRKALATLRPLRESQPGLYLDSVLVLGDGLTIDNRYAEVVALADGELPFARRRGSPAEQARLLRQRGWAHGQLGAIRAAETDLRAAVATYERARVAPSRIVASTYSDLAQVLSDAGKPREALDLLRKAGDIHAHSADSPWVDRLINQQNMAREHYRLGETAQAVALLEAEVPQLEKIAGEGFPQASTARNLLSQAYAAQGRYDAALEIGDRNLRIHQNQPDADEETLQIFRLTRAKMLTYAGRADEALPLAEKGVEFLRRKYPQPTTLRGRAQWILGETLLRRQRCDRAEPVLRAALGDERAMTGGKPSAPAGEALDSLGRCRIAAGDFPAAETLLTQAVAEFTAAGDAGDVRVLRSQAHLAWVRHRRSPGAGTLSQLRAAIARMDQALDPGHQALRKQLDGLLRTASDPDAARTFAGLNSFS